MRILQLTSYPTTDPRHGGQIRCAQIATQLRDAGHEVKSLAVYVERDYTVVGEDDVPFNSSSSFWREDLPWLSDYFSGIFAAQESSAVSALSRVVQSFAPSVIIVEHPWLFDAAQRIAQMGEKIVYSSHNVEWRLKDRLFARDGHATRGEMVASIRQIEINAAKMADLVVACTADDLEYYDGASGSSKGFNGVVAGNGVEPFSCTDERVKQWRDFFKEPMPVFVSSAHLPNAQGFWDMMSPGLTFLRPEEQILVIGGVSAIILQASGCSDYRDVNINRLNIAGPRDKTELQALVRASHVVLLPITDGEGSNLKTAEALESGCSIIGTSKAFRGFEAGMTLSHVQIADTARDFRAAVRRVLDRPRYTGGTPEVVRSRFYWKEQLQPIVEAVGKLALAES
jgi:glycosyltransferase involved in cell wall biosynthesis